MASTPSHDAPRGAAPPSGGPGRKAFVAVPALTFLAGAVLGGVLVAIGTPDGGGVVGAADAAPSVSPTGSGATTGSDDGDPTASAGPESGVVPESCLEAAELSQQLLGLTERAAGAITDFDAAELQSLLDEAQAIDPALREAAAACQDVAGAGGTG